MIGAIIGDIAGSRFEFAENPRRKDFELFAVGCDYTDDTLMTLAVGKAVMECGKKYEALSRSAVENMRAVGKKYPFPCGGYGGMFAAWLISDNPLPYGSFGNGAAMRVSACGLFARSMKDAKRRALAVTKVTHDHIEGLKGAEATAAAIYLARKGKSKKKIRKYIHKRYYKLNDTVEELQKSYKWDGSCQGCVPQAITAFLESVDFEDAIRGAVSIGGDSDTIGAITGSIAGAYYGVPEELRARAEGYLTEDLLAILREIEGSKRFPKKFRRTEK